MYNKGLSQAKNQLELVLSKENQADETTKAEIVRLKSRISGFERFGENPDFSKIKVNILAGKAFKTTVIEDSAAYLSELQEQYNNILKNIRKEVVPSVMDQ
jgi:altronate dehydratase